MASFIGLHLAKDFNTFLEKRLLQVAKLECLISQLCKLDTEELQLRAFKRLEAKLETELLSYESINNAIQTYIIKKGVDILTDANYLADQETYNKNVISYETKIESYHNLLVEKGLIMRQGLPPKMPTLEGTDEDGDQEVANGVSAATSYGMDLTNVLEAIANTQKTMSNCLAQKAKTPQFKQPIFEAKNTKSDHLNFKH